MGFSTDKTKPNIVVDFDGVLHSYESGWQGPTEIPDPPVEGAKEWLDELTEYFDVHVLSSRTPAEGGVDAMREWCFEYFGPELTSELYFPHTKPPYYVMTIDDNAFCFEGRFPSIEYIQEFESWTK